MKSKDMRPRSPSAATLAQQLRRHALWIALTMAIGLPAAQAQQVHPDGGTHTGVLNAANGVPVVNIAAPNSAGVSHNTYQQFDVGSNGLILNNSGAISNTQLAGYITGNPNLGAGQSASLILNEVTSTLPSQLNGAMEVAGNKAQVVVANPNGISCEGCGFINASRGVLTTGTPVFASDGSLSALRVTGGTITVGGTGLNGTAPDRIDLLARAVAINAGVWANQLNVVTGPNQIDYATLATQSIAGTGSKPAFALDVAALGGMYANAIRLIGTEAGLGVNSQGQIAAQNGNLTLTSAGQVVLGGKTTATGNLVLDTTQALSNTGTLAAGGTVSLASGDFANSGTLYGNGAITVSANGSVGNSGQIEAQDGALDVQAQGAITGTSGSSVYAGGPITLTGASFGNAGTWESAQGVSLQVGGDAGNSGNLQADAGNLDLTAATIGNTGRLAVGGNAALNASTSLTSSGTLVADGAVTLTAPSLATAGTVQAGSALALAGTTLTNGGKLDALDGAWTATLGGGFINQGGGAIYGSRNVTVNAASLTNAGGIEAQRGDAITLTGALTNSGVLQSDQADVEVTAASLANSGTLSATRNLQVQTGGAVQNGGVLVSGQAMNLSSASFDNQTSGQIQSGADLTLTAAAQSNEGAIDAKGNATLSGTSLSNAAGAQWLAAGTFTLDQTGNVTNAGVLQAGSGLTMTQAAALTNSGTLQTLGGNLALAANTLASSGTLGAGGNATLSAGTSLSSTGTLLADGAVTLTAPGLTTAGTVQAGSSLSLGGTTLTNSGKLDALDGAWTATLGGGFTNQGGGTIYGSQNVTVNAASLTNAGGIEAQQGDAITLTGALANSGTLQSDQGDIGLAAASLSNSGTLSAQRNLQVQASGAVQNGGVLVSGQAMSLSSGSFDNQASGQIQSGTDASFAAATLSNEGAIGIKGNATLSGTSLSNAAGAQWLAAGTLTLDQTGGVTNAGVLQAGGTFDMQHATSLTNSGTLQTTGGNLTLLTGTLASSGTLGASGDAVLGASQSLGSTGTLVAGGALSLSSPQLATAGAVEAGGALTLSGGTLSNDGKLYALGGNWTATLGGAFTNQDKGDIYGSQGLTLAAASLDSAGGIEARQAVGITVAGAFANGGTLQSDQAGITVSAASLANTGTLSADQVLQWQVAQAAQNSGVLVSGQAMDLSSAGFDNQAGGQIQSGTDLALSATTLNNKGTVNAKGSATLTGVDLGNTGQLLAAGALTVGETGNVANAGVLQAGSDFTLTQAASLTNAANATLYAGQDFNLDLSRALTNAGMLYAARTSTLSTGSVDNTGTLRSGGDLALTSTGNVVSSGAIQAQQGLTLTGGADVTNGGKLYAIDGGLTVQSAGAFSSASTGDIYSGQAIGYRVGSFANAGTLEATQGVTVTAQGQASNSGTVQADGGTVTITASGLANQGTLSANGNLQLDATGTLGNTGKVVANGTLGLTGSSFDNSGQMQSAGNATVQAAAIDNSGRLQTGGALAISHDTTLTNEAGGLLLAAGDLSADTASLLDNAGTIQAGGNLSVEGAGAIDTAAGSTLYGTALTTLQLGGGFSNAGTVYGGQGLQLTAASVDNAGVLRSDAALTVTTQGDAGNGGTAYAAGNAGWNVGGTLTDTGVLASSADTTLTVGSLAGNGTLAAGLKSDGTLGTSGDLDVTAAGSLAAQGRALAAGNLDFSGQSIDLSGSQTRAGGDLTLSATQGDVTTAGGNLAANGTVSITTPGSLVNGGSTAAQGGTISGSTLSLTAASLDNRYGTLTQTGTHNLTLAFTGAFDNAHGTLASNAGSLTLQAASLDDTGGAILQAGTGTLTLTTTGDLTNTGGRIAGNGALDLQSGGTFANGGGTLSLAGDATLHAVAIANSQGTWLAGNIDATATQAFTNTGGTVQAAGALTLDAGSLDNTGGFLKVTGAQALGLDVDNALTNGSGGFIGGNGGVTLQAGSLANAGQIYAGQTLGATVQGALDNDGGALQAMGSLSATSGGALGNRSGRIEAGAGDSGATLTLAAASLDNTAGRIADSGQGATTVNGGQGITNEGGTLGGQGAVTLSAGSLDNSQGGHLVAGQDLALTLGSMDNASGTVYAAGNLAWNNANASLANNAGNLGAGGDLALALQSLADKDGTVDANGNVTLAAATLTDPGRLAAGQSLTLTTGGGYVNTATSQLTANDNLTLDLGGSFSNAAGATLQAPGQLTIHASSIDNAAGAVLNSSYGTTLTTGGALTNEGNIEGSAITLDAGALTNTATIMGGTIVATANTLTNGADLGTATTNSAYQSALIAGSQSIALYVGGTLLNRDATIFTTGNLTIAANASGGMAQAVTNLSGDIEADGSIVLDATQFTNQRRVFQTTTVDLTSAQQAQNTSPDVTLARYLSTDTNPDHQPPNVTAAQVISPAEFAEAKAFCDARIGADARCDGYPFGKGAPNVFQSQSTDVVTSVTQLAAASAQSQLLASGNITLNGSVLNDKSTIAAGNDLLINGSTSTATVQNIAWAPTAQVAVTTQDQTDSQYLKHDPRRWLDGGYWTYGTTTSQEQISLAPGSVPSWVTYDAGAGLAASLTAGNTVSITAQTIDNTVVDAGGQPVQAAIGLGANSGAQNVSGSAAGTVAQASGTGGSVAGVTVGSAPGQTGGGSLSLAGAHGRDGTTAPGATTTQGVGLSGASAPGGTSSPTAASTPTVATASASTPAASHTASAASGNTASVAAPQVVSTLVGPQATVTLPQSGLYTVSTSPTAHYLIETNPQFTQYTQFISSDYLLQQLGYDPEATEERLGDGFYEEQQVLDQITDLTGRRFLGNDTDALDQYRQLMGNAVGVAKQFDLSVGVALTPAQMASLTEDIVWLVSVTVDGKQVLEPVVYLSAADAKSMAASGATIAGTNVILDASGNLTNNGTISASNNAQITADNLLNSGSIRAGNDLSINAAQDILNGGTLSAGGNVSLVAGNDVLSGVSVAQSLGAVSLAGLGSPVSTVALTNLSMPGSISAGGNLSISAGRDLTLDTAPVAAGANLSLAAGRDLTATATAITAGGDAQLLAGRDLSLLSTASTNRTGEAHNSVETTTHTISTLTAGGTLSLLAGNDLLSQGATLTGSTLNLAAGHDLTLAAVTDSTTRLTQGLQGHTLITTGQTDQTVRGSTLTGTDGISVLAGHDLTTLASTLTSTKGDVSLVAGHDLNLDSAQENDSSYRDTVTSHHGLLSSSKTETQATSSDSYAIGTTVSGNDVTLAAGNDLSTQAAQLEANGALSLSAVHDVTLGAGEQTHTSSYAEEQKSSSVFNTGATRFGSLDPESYSRGSQSSTAQTWSIGSTLSGDTVNVAAGHDLSGTAVQIAGTHDVTLAAGNDLTLNAGADTYSQSDSTKVSRTGLMNGGGFSALIGNRTTKDGNTVQDTSYTGSLVGSTDGAVTLTAGNDVHLTGSDVLSQTATTIVGKNVTIDAALGSEDTTQTQSVHTGGIHVGITGGAVSVAEGVYNAAQGASHSSDSRLKALYAMQAAQDLYSPGAAHGMGLASGNGADALGEAVSDPHLAAGKGDNNSGSGINLQVGLTASTASSETKTHDDVAYGSQVSSQGNVTVAATNGDLNIVGSQVNGNDVALSASHDLNLLSQAEQHTDTSHNSNASGGVGINIGSSGIGFYAQAALGKGEAHGNGTTHDDTVVDASNTLTLVSGNDTTIQGAQAKGQSVLADIGGNLDIASEQDTDDYASSQWQAAGQVVVGMGASASGSLSASKANSHYASVTEMSGIGAGSGGFAIDVGGNTDLKGAVIASSASPDKNVLDTGSLTYSNIENVSKSSAESISVGSGGGLSSLSGGIGVPQNSDQHSTTQAGIAQGTIVVGNEANPNLAGLDRNPSLDNANGLTDNFNPQKVAENEQTGLLAGQVGMTAAGDLEQYMQSNATTDAQKAAWSNGGADSILLHTAVGAATAALGGGNALQGAEGAAAGEGILDALPANTNSILTGLASTSAGALVGGGAGASTALDGEIYNREQHLNNYQSDLASCQNDPSGSGCTTTLAMTANTMPQAQGTAANGDTVVANISNDTGQPMSYVIGAGNGNGAVIMQPLEYEVFQGMSSTAQNYTLGLNQWNMDDMSAMENTSAGNTAGAEDSLQHMATNPETWTSLAFNTVLAWAGVAGGEGGGGQLASSLPEQTPAAPVDDAPPPPSALAAGSADAPSPLDAEKAPPWIGQQQQSSTGTTNSTNVADAVNLSANNVVGSLAQDVPNAVDGGPGSVDLQLTYKDGWTDAQRAEADAKVQILNDSDTVVTEVNRSGTSASSRYLQSGGLVPPGYDVDHMVDLQLGGADNVSNMWPLNSSVNRSLGAQVQWQIKGLQPGTVVNRVTIGD